jgi:hypothetical protein
MIITKSRAVGPHHARFRSSVLAPRVIMLCDQKGKSNEAEDAERSSKEPDTHISPATSRAPTKFRR